MTNSDQDKPISQKMNWKTQTYMIGAVVGAVMGLLSAYLFAQEAEDASDNKEDAPDIPASVLLGLALSALSFVRQIAESGRKKRDGKK
ncbi:MAG: hypothetical protein ACFE0Q_21525 [Anaerolineae bacterium]